MFNQALRGRWRFRPMEAGAPFADPRR